MHSHTRSFKTKLAMLACAVAFPALVAGCGGVPGNAVATVDGDPIEKSEFDHWMTIAAKSGGQQATQIPQPPEFKNCVDNKRKTLPKPAKGQPKTTDAQLKQQCKQEYEQLRNQVLQLLISLQWIDKEAEELEIKVTDAEVQKQFDTQKKASFPKDADFQKFLTDSGQTVADIKRRVRADLLSQKIREKVTKGKDKVTDAQIKKYYDENKQRFAQPERRDLLVVLTKTKARADQARSALADGQAWAKVAKRYSIDQASKAQGGKLAAVAKGQQEKALDDAVFAADRNELTGPVKTQFGYYVFKVTKVTEASQQSLDEAKTTIKQLLASQQQQKALDAFVKEFRSKWKDETECREGYVIQDCSNAPKPKPSPTAAPGAVPQTPQTPPAGATGAGGQTAPQE
ncbi:MAG TPA: peptidyl-prolyl cis-trans isomerase [Solirubrobacteraceae bacterium]|nr:peptidyl-prolyl cis-trans isomerase [Solirubrobacteraceae bacterium]